MSLLRVQLPVVLLGLAACGGGSSGPSTPTVGSVALAPATASIAVGGTTTLTATVKDGAGVAMTDQPLTWSSGNSAVATVASGLVSGVTPGQTTISATSANGKVGSATIKVIGPPASITVTRSGSFLLVGDTLQPGAQVKDAGGNVLSGTSVTWSISGGAATLAGAVVTATAPGSAQVTATAGSINGSAILTVVPGGGTREPALASMDSTIIAEMARLAAPGASVSISRNGRLVLSRAYGYADTVTRRVAATDQLWRIGSTSKPITAVAVMKLVEAGLINLTDKPFTLLTGVDVLPGQTQDPRLPNVTVKDLLQHSGGWNGNRDVDAATFAALQSNGNFDPKVLISSGRGVALAAAPGTRFAYTNYEYLVLGRMIERATGVGYETYVKNSILAPAGITTMKLGRTPIGLRDPKEVSYYDKRGVVTALYGTGIWPDVGGGQEYAEASGQWIASSLDLVKFLGEVDGNSVRPDILSSATMATMAAQDLAVWPTVGYHYGLGWAVTPVGASNSLSHAGGQDGGDAYIVRRSDGVNIAVLFNMTRAGDAGPFADAGIDLTLGRITVWPTGIVF